MRFYCYLNGSQARVMRWLREEAWSVTSRSKREMIEMFARLLVFCAADILAEGHDRKAARSAEVFGQLVSAIIDNMPVHTSDISYSARRLTTALSEPKLIGPFLKVVLQCIQDGSLANQEAEIAAAARKWAERQKNNGG